MTGPDEFPGELAVEVEAPPRLYVDRTGREIAIRTYGDGPPSDPEAEFEALVSMYTAFDAADRAQGIPPAGEDRVRRWLKTLLVEEAVNVLAWHGTEAVGHATLVPDGCGAYELAIFVLQPYQRAGIGRELMRALLGEGEARSVERVWLTVEHWNTAAVSLYRDVGFETTGAESFEREMGLTMG